MKTPPDALLASDLAQLARPANVFRFRVDGRDAVVDFGYVPPLLENEASRLSAGSVAVHTRVALPLALAEQLVHQLSQLIEQVKAGSEAP